MRPIVKMRLIEVICYSHKKKIMSVELLQNDFRDFSREKNINQPLGF